MSNEGSSVILVLDSAEQDMGAIWDFTAELWSPTQADHYLTEIWRAFSVIADNPEIARERTEYQPPVRIYRCQSHVIVFREEAGRVTIIRVRHGHEDWTSDPFGGRQG